MPERFVSEGLRRELPNAMLNFIWYLWELYCDPDNEVSVLELRPGDKGQRVTVAGQAVEQDFGTAVEAQIVILKSGNIYLMSRR
jgi:hypothetical protein